jgi:serine/threonine protein kinase
MLENKARALEKKIAIEKIKKVLDLKNSLILIVAKVAASLVTLHEIKIVHCDLLLANIMYNMESRDLKLIDLGCASKEGIWPYSGRNLYLLRTAPEVVSAFDGDMGESMEAVIHPAADVYALGSIAICVWFGPIAKERILLDSNYKQPPGTSDRAHIYAQFYSGIRNAINEVNLLLPPALQYSQAEIKFMVSFLELCMHPDPRERPTSAQACHILECFAAGCIDFDEVKKMAEKDRPTPKDYFSENAVEQCKNAIWLYKGYGLLQEILGPPEPSTAENFTPAEPLAAKNFYRFSPGPVIHSSPPPSWASLSEDQPPSDQSPEDR